MKQQLPIELAVLLFSYLCGAVLCFRLYMKRRWARENREAWAAYYADVLEPIVDEAALSR